MEVIRVRRSSSRTWVAFTGAVVLAIMVLWSESAHGPSPDTPAAAAPRIVPALASEPLAAVITPTEFQYQGKRWIQSADRVTPREVVLRDIGITVARNIVYARLNAKPPYTTLFVETHPGSEVFAVYRMR